VLGNSPKFQRAEAVVPLTYSPNVTVDLRRGTHYTLDITDGHPWKLEDPVDSGSADPATVMVTKEIALELRNGGSAPGGPVTLGPRWKLVGGQLAPPAPGTRTVLKAMFNGADCVEVSRAAGIAA
jgi:hypothetical protein